MRGATARSDAGFLQRFQMFMFIAVVVGVAMVGLMWTKLPGAAVHVSVVLGLSLTMLSFGYMLLQKLLARGQGDHKMVEIAMFIREGAEGYLATQYSSIAKMAAVVGVILGFIFYFQKQAPGSQIKLENTQLALITLIAFTFGASCSGISGYIGMWMSVRVNARVACAAADDNYPDACMIALKGGLVSGILVVGLLTFGLATMFASVHLYIGAGADHTVRVPHLIVGYGFGASLVALFAQLGGGIYTKAADVGADMVGKVEQNIPEDDPRNPAVIADLVGDNVGDCAGRGADLFESITGEILGAMIIGAQLANDAGMENPVLFMFFPLLVHVFDILISSIGVMIVKPQRTHMRISTVTPHSPDVELGHGDNHGWEDPLRTIERGYLYSLGMAVCVFLGLTRWMLHTEKAPQAWLHYFGCGLIGIVTSYLFVLFTKYYTDYNFAPVKKIAQASKTGHGTNVIAGMAVGFESCALPVVTISFAMIGSFWLGQTGGLVNKSGDPTGGLFGNAVATMGMLGTAVYVLSMDTFGPITDNAGGIVEMAEKPESARSITDRLDAVGNVTKATTKGYSIGAAALASFLLLRAFMDLVEEYTGKEKKTINLAIPEVFIAGLLGGMLIFLFSGFCMTAVGTTAQEVVKEVRRQFEQRPGIMDGKEQPDYERCVSIVTQASLREMIKPGLLAVTMPVTTGFIFRLVGQYTNRPLLGVECVCSMLLFSTATGVLTALFLNNAGGAWDNAKKYVETGFAGGKGSFAHQAAVTGDTVGDPCKDTAGPSIHVLIKLISTITLVTAPVFLPSASISA
eukprot:TRINITY_DN509_c0_g1_i2.p1 TRINITY_DN509_c0_g1~~TRINITY_DN509_c0_g1_i2.p1  ORF type:complete len:801 (+),score=335.18 TRINITY_DN509_c0_g1_i2:108-2510(+)